MARACPQVKLTLPLSTPARATKTTVITLDDNEVFMARVGGNYLNCLIEIDSEQKTGRGIKQFKHKIA